MTRILAVDPGDVRIGLAISDPTRTIAQPLDVLRHSSRQQDAEAILQIAIEHEAEMILIGVPLDLDGELGPQARKVMRLVRVLQEISDLQIETWDESGSTRDAQQQSHGTNTQLDARSAAVILQDYLDAKKR